MSAVVDIVLAAQVVVFGAQEDSDVHFVGAVAGHVYAVGEGLVVQTCLACAVVDVLAILGHLHVHCVV